MGGYVRDCAAAEVRHARADVDVTIACSVVGDGPVTTVVVSE